VTSGYRKTGGAVSKCLPKRLRALAGSSGILGRVNVLVWACFGWATRFVVEFDDSGNAAPRELTVPAAFSAT
jgi:hypothetical protein